jgi:hypothetical protein
MRDLAEAKNMGQAFSLSPGDMDRKVVFPVLAALMLACSSCDRAPETDVNPDATSAAPAAPIAEGPDQMMQAEAPAPSGPADPSAPPQTALDATPSTSVIPPLPKDISELTEAEMARIDAEIERTKK